MKSTPSETSLSSGKKENTLSILIHTFNLTGHVLPMQAIAKALVARGHRVVWTTATGQEARVLASGAEFIATNKVDFCDLGLQSAVTYNECISALVDGRLLAQVTDFRRVLNSADLRVDCLLADAFPMGAAAMFDLGEVPMWATVGVVPMYTPQSVPKSTSTVGTIISTPEHLLPSINAQRKQLGLLDTEAKSLHYSPFLHLQASCASLEFDKNIPETTHYVGPLVAPRDQSTFTVEQSWWLEVVGHPCMVVVTQGTYAVNPSLLHVPTIEALCNEKDLLLIVLSPLAEDIREQSIMKGVCLDSVRLATWMPYDLILPQCRLLITNGGYGSVTQALSFGVPLVCAGTTEDKKDTAARVVAAGAGIDLATDTPTRDQIKAAVRSILYDKSYKKNAQKVQVELNVLGGSEKACDLLVEAIAKNARSNQ
ncbi:hypothetical protein WAI453_001517 [Rhynchosporium graminicola]|uniref:Erythromycin biosynthesis protein CIII-like C-terminal domain-containing protein n=1 Tax=Rhynchosporium graminicola TaxID=2792576 RepID=A0A1E1KC84_9HELO|nr:uncharacterized protein RCO7_10946 [Rhynchosporium commune]